MSGSGFLIDGVPRQVCEHQLVRSRWIVACSFALAASWHALPAAQAQTHSDVLRPYRDAVALYRNGNVARAIETADSWTIRELAAVQAAIASDADGPFVNGFAVLMTEAARALSTEEDAHRLGVVETILRTRPKGPGATEFLARWYDVVASSYISALKPAPASDILDRALRSAPGDARLAYLRGLAKEVAAYLVDPSCPPPGCTFDGRRSQEPALLRAAVTAYEQALANDEHLTIARVHLGRVLYLEKSGDRASAELRRAVNESVEAKERYLALLFLGAISDTAGKSAEAIGAYRMAIETAPQYPVGHLALEWAEYTAGSGRSLPAPPGHFSEPPVPEDGDPWWAYQQPPQDDSALQWLKNHIEK
jgi:tetratricopeptide (TPR) repeat protein